MAGLKVTYIFQLMRETIFNFTLYFYYLNVMFRSRWFTFWQVFCFLQRVYVASNSILPKSDTSNCDMIDLVNSQFILTKRYEFRYEVSIIGDNYVAIVGHRLKIIFWKHDPLLCIGELNCRCSRIFITPHWSCPQLESLGDVLIRNLACHEVVLESI